MRAQVRHGVPAAHDRPRYEVIHMNDRTLGTIAMICAPALLVEGLIEELLLGGQDHAPITGITGTVFIVGWICSNTVMRRMKAAGIGKWGRAALLIQLAGLVLASVPGLLEATGLLGRGNVIFVATDAAWPLSMLWMLVVGVSVIAAGRLSGWRRFVPLLCPLWLPIALIGGAAFGDAAGFAGLGFSAVLWLLLGYIVRGDSKQIAPEPAYAE